MRYMISAWDAVLLVILVVVGAALVVGAFRALGFLGIDLIGLMTGLIALNVEIQGGRAIGTGFTPRLYAEQIQAEDRLGGDDKLALIAERRSATVPLFVAKVASAGMVILGFGLFFVFQL